MRRYLSEEHIKMVACKLYFQAVSAKYALAVRVYKCLNISQFSSELLVNILDTKAIVELTKAKAELCHSSLTVARQIIH